MSPANPDTAGPPDRTLPAAFTQAIADATATAFAGRRQVTTSFGELVRLADVQHYNRKAEEPLAIAFDTLAAVAPATVAVVQQLYPLLVPHFIGSGTINPVHHTAYVLRFMATILVGEKKTEAFHVTVGMLAALFHDVSQGLATRPKITEAHLQDKVRQVVRQECSLSDLKTYLDAAVASRREHMDAGALLAEEILRKQHLEGVNSHEIDEIARIIRHHDDPKIPVAYHVVRKMFAEDAACQAWQSQLPAAESRHLEALLAETGRHYLFAVDDWLLQYHHEADLLWMLTHDGIEADLARFAPTERKPARKMLEHNIGLHCQEVDLYRTEANFAAYHFQQATAYRSATGYRLFQELTQTPVS